MNEYKNLKRSTCNIVPVSGNEIYVTGALRVSISYDIYLY